MIRNICDACHNCKYGGLCITYNVLKRYKCDFCNDNTTICNCGCKCKPEVKTVKKKKIVKTVEKTEASTVRVRLAIHDELQIIKQRTAALDKEQDELSKKLKEAEKLDDLVAENENKIEDLLVIQENLEECITILGK